MQRSNIILVVLTILLLSNTSTAQNTSELLPRRLGQVVLLGGHKTLPSDAQWQQANVSLAHTDASKLEAEVRFDVVYQNKKPIAARATLLNRQSKRLEFDWQVQVKNDLAHATLHVSLGKKHKTSTRVEIGPHAIDPHAHLRFEDRFLLPSGIMFRCPNGTVKLCRRLVRPLSYNADVPVHVSIELLRGATDLTSAKQHALISLGRSFQDISFKSAPKTAKGLVLEARVKKGPKPWAQVQKVGQHWTMCSVESRANMAQFTKRVGAIWLKRARRLCAAIEPSPRFAQRPDCKASLDQCVASCGAGDGALCRMSGAHFARQSALKKARVYFEMGCKHDDGASCRHVAMSMTNKARKTHLARACALEDVEGCALYADLAIGSKRINALEFACKHRHAQSCLTLSSDVKKRNKTRAFALAKRACALGSLDACFTQ